MYFPKKRPLEHRLGTILGYSYLGRNLIYIHMEDKSKPEFRGYTPIQWLMFDETFEEARTRVEATIRRVDSIPRKPIDPNSPSWRMPAHWAKGHGV